MITTTGIGAHRNRVDEEFTMPAGIIGCHALSNYKDKYVLATTRDSASTANTLTRFDVDDFSNKVTITLPVQLTGTNRVHDQVVFGDKLYISYTSSTANNTPVLMGIIDIPTMTYLENFNTFNPNSFGPGSGSLATDGVQYIYYASAGSKAEIYKFDALNNMAHVATWVSSPALYGRNHCLRYENGMLYSATNQASPITGGNPAFNYVVKVDASTMTEVNRATFSAQSADRFAPTDDWCIVNNKIYLAMDTNIGASMTPVCNIAILDATTLAIIDTISEPTVNGGLGYMYGTWYDGKYIYGGAATDPAVLLKIDPSDDSYEVINMGASNIAANEMCFSVNNGAMYLTYWMNTGSPATIPYNIARYYNI